MATADQYIEQAAKYIGISGTDNIFNTWYWGYHCYDSSIYPWCACFQSYTGVHDLDMPFEPSASAAGVANQGDRVRIDDANRGDWVLFNWDGRQSFGWSDHIGLVEWFDHDSGYFGTIEGNCGNQVKRVTRTVNSSYSTAFFTPPYDNSPQPEPEPQKSDDLKYVNNFGGGVHRLYNPSNGCHHLTLSDGEVSNLVASGWNDEGVLFEAPKSGRYPIYRMYNKNDGDHVFISSFEEASNLESLGWRLESVPFFSNDSGTEVYRLYNPNSGQHVYSASPAERDYLASIGWNLEGYFNV